MVEKDTNGFVLWTSCADLGGFAAANDHVGKRDPHIREILGNQFPKHLALAFWLLTREMIAGSISGGPPRTFGERFEKELISSFVGRRCIGVR